MSVWKRLKSVTNTSVNSITVTFDETTALDTNHLLFATFTFSGSASSIASNSWSATPLSGSASNGSILYLGAYAKRGGSNVNSLTITFTDTITYVKVDLFAFEGYASLTPHNTYAQSASSTTVTSATTAATTIPNTVAIAAVGLIGSNNGWTQDWSGSFDQVPRTSGDRLSTAVSASASSSKVYETDTSWTTARNIRTNIWVMQGVSATQGGSDVTAPTVSITYPASGATLSGSTTISITAADATGVTSVSVYADDTPLGNAIQGSGNAWSLSVNTANYADDGYTLTARASDAAGNTRISANVPVSFQNGVVAPAPTQTTTIVGDKDVARFYAGSALVDRMYMGNTLVYGDVPDQGSGTPTPVTGTPTRVKSYGPNGTHWPSDTPFYYNLTGVTVVEVDPDWAKIKTAIVNASTNDNKTAILIKNTTGSPITLTGNGTASSSTPTLENIGRLDRTSKILVAPKNGFGSIILGGTAGGVKLTNVSNVAFALFDGTKDSVITFAGCRKTSLVWTRTGKFNRNGDPAYKYTTYQSDGYEVVCSFVSMVNNDRAAMRSYGNVNAQFKDINDYGCYYAPAYRTSRSNWPEDEPPHCDTLQLSGSYMSGMKWQDSILWASQNTALQVGGTSNAAQLAEVDDYYVRLEHTILVGGGATTNTRYPADSSVPMDFAVQNNTSNINGNDTSKSIGTDMGGGSGINGGGISGKMDAVDQSFLMGGGVANVGWRNVTGDTRSYTDKAGQSGAFVKDMAFSSYPNSTFNSLSPVPTTAYLNSIWGANRPAQTQKNLPAVGATA